MKALFPRQLHNIFPVDRIDIRNCRRRSFSICPLSASDGRIPTGPFIYTISFWHHMTTTGIKVLYLPPITGSELESLRGKLNSRIDLVQPVEVPEGDFLDNFDYFLEFTEEHMQDLLDGTDVVVGYRFPPDPLRHAVMKGRLKAVVVPFAGMPVSDRRLFLSLPDLIARSCHFNSEPVAEHAVAMFLSLAKRLPVHDSALRRGDWNLRYTEKDSILIHGKTALIVGTGRVGVHIGRLLSALGMKVIGLKRTVDDDIRSNLEREIPGLIALEEPTSLSRHLPAADLIVLCAPGTLETRGMIGADELALMKKGAILVNVSRGNLVDEKTLFEVLESGTIGGAALDVWWNYPATRDDRNNTFPSRYPFQDLDNVIMSPHRGGHVAERELLRAEALAPILNEIADRLADVMEETVE